MPNVWPFHQVKIFRKNCFISFENPGLASGALMAFTAALVQHPAVTGLPQKHPGRSVEGPQRGSYVCALNDKPVRAWNARRAALWMGWLSKARENAGEFSCVKLD